MSFRIGTPRTTSRFSVLRMPPMMRLSPCRIRFSLLVTVRSVTIGNCLMPSGVRYAAICAWVSRPMDPSAYTFGVIWRESMMS